MIIWKIICLHAKGDSTDKWERAVELLDKVNTKTTEAMYLLTQGEDKEFTQEMLEDLAICTKVK